MANQLGNGLNVTRNGVHVEIVPFVYVLDEWPTDIEYAFSFRLLRSAYAGACFRVRRTSDNAETDIGFNGDYVDTAALVAYIGASSGRIVKWYDQSGNGNDKIQTTAAEQPFIITGGTLHQKNGKLAAYTDASQDAGLTNALSIAGNSAMAFHVLEPAGECLPATGAGGFYGVQQSGNAGSPTLNMGAPTYYKNKVAIAAPTRDDLFDAFDTLYKLMSVTNLDLSLYILISSKYPAYRGILGLSFEEIVYGTQTEPRSDIEDNIISYYGL